MPSISPVPRLMARSMLSLGMDTARALSMAYRSFKFIVGSPPPWRAAMMMARLSLLHSLPRLASMAPFLCLIVAQCECPDMASPLRSLRCRGVNPPPAPGRGREVELEPLQLLLNVLVAVIRLRPVALLIQLQRLLPRG